MYHYIEDKEFLGKMKNLCSDIMNQLKQQINNDSVMKVDIHLVGSGAKNLITQNENEPIDLDYNICVEEVYGIRFNDGKAIKIIYKNTLMQFCKNLIWKTVKTLPLYYLLTQFILKKVIKPSLKLISQSLVKQITVGNV